MRFRCLFAVTGRHRRIQRAVAACAALAATLLLAVPVQADTAPASCQDLYFPVTILGTPQTMYGRLCVPAGGARTVEVLIPGASYDSAYWDPRSPSVSSFRLAMNNGGYATLTVDRVGTGRSSRPPSVLLTSVTQAGAVHQVVQDLRAGTKSQAFDKVILGGHSVGSAVAIIEAGTYHDVDGVLVTGLTHGINPIGAAAIVATLIPAALDPKFAGKGYDLGYLTTDPGTRYASFQKPGPYLPAVAAMDESTKAVFATGEVVDTVLIGVVSTYSKLITVPVMLVMGQDDPAFCGGLIAPDCSTAATLLRDEAPYYSAKARLQTYVVDDWGHSINYAPDAPGYQAAVIAWANKLVGR
ncbi:MAG TPA: alpha/beta hydrolase [Pseudonocardiaceae bacterium]|nr:alpha/beta hydrolase [Pseudonocardiaceae bacterium]